MLIKTTGYKFMIFNNVVAFEMLSKTELTLEESHKKINDFFENFKILKTERITPEMSLAKRSVSAGAPSQEEQMPVKPVKIARPKAEPMHLKWGVLRGALNDEFNRSEYVQALKDAGYEYTDMSWDTIPTSQLYALIKLGKITLIPNSKPKRYKKIKIDLTLKDNKEKDALVKSMKKGNKVILDSFR